MLNKKLTIELAPMMNELEVLRKSQMLSPLILDNAHDLGTRLNQAEAALQRQIEAQALLLEISKQFANSDIQAIDAMVNTTLRRIGQFDKSDRSYVLVLSEDQFTISSTYEWCAEGISPQIGSLQGLPVNVLPWWNANLQNLNYLYIPRVEGMPPEARSEKEILQAQSIQSLTVVPMFLADKIMGFLGFDSIRSEKNWAHENIVMLESAAQIIVNSLQRRKNAQALQHSENYYRTIFVAMIQAEGEMDLLRNVCQKLIEVGRYNLAWVGYVREDEQQKVWPAAYAGTDGAYLAKLNISLQDPRRGRGPVGNAIRTGQPIVSQDFKKDETFKPWLKDALRRGFKSCMALPLTADDNVFGLLSIYADETDVFDSQEQKLLLEIANYLAYAIIVMRARNERTRAINLNDTGNRYLTG